MAGALAKLRAQADGESRASIMNLVAWAADPEAAEDIQGVIEGLADHQPSRTLVIARARGPDGIDASVQVHSRPSAAADHHAVRIEQVALRLRGAVADHAASVVIPLLRPDLPTFVWWPGVPDPGEPAFEELCGVGDRLVSEAGRGPDARVAVWRLARAAAVPGGPAVTDLAWAAITPWRQLLVQVAGGRPGSRLGGGRLRAELVHGGDGPSVEALLLAGWLADVLEPSPLLRLVPAPGESAPLQALRLEGDDGRVAVERVADHATCTVTMQEADGEPRTRIMPLPHPRREALLAGELEVTRRDGPFERAVARARDAA